MKEAETSHKSETTGGEPTGPEIEIRDRMERRRRDRRLKEWLDGCDPELTVLAILIAQTRFYKPTEYGPLADAYQRDPDGFLEEAGIPAAWREVWNKGDWETFEQYIDVGKPVTKPGGLPASRGFP